MSRWLEDYYYHLPAERIAQRPSRFRDHSRLLVLGRVSERLVHSHFYRFLDYIREGDVLVLNDTAVLKARLFGRKAGSGGRIEILLLSPLGGGRWRALMKGRCCIGTLLDFGQKGIMSWLEDTGREGEVVVRFDPPDGATKLKELSGYPPLPPYIRRHEELAREWGKMDLARYQTVYADKGGSVAAPTAGLHFTRRLLERVRAKKVDVTSLTLHVGPGTFRPLRYRDVWRNKLEAEETAVTPATARTVNMARERGGRVIAVGTTVTRALEHFATGEGKIRGGRKKVDLMIRPGYRFRVVDAMVTNFHLPCSSLLLLVSAFAGRENVLGAYREAIRMGYRFYSYGDAMLIV